MHNQYGNQGLVVLGVNAEDSQRQRAFAREQGINYPLLIRSANLPPPYGIVSAFPTTFLIDRQGLIRKVYVGALGKEFFEAEIVKLLGQ